MGTLVSWADALEHGHRVRGALALTLVSEGDAELLGNGAASLLASEFGEWLGTVSPCADAPSRWGVDARGQATVSPSGDWAMASELLGFAAYASSCLTTVGMGDASADDKLKALQGLYDAYGWVSPG